MESTDTPPRQRHRLLRIALPLILVALVCVAGFGLGVLTTPPQPPDPPPPAATGPKPFPDDTPVIGVSLNGRHRAYELAGLWQPPDHVFNDLWGDVPVSVTFCNLDNCVRAFTSEQIRGDWLKIRNGGADPWHSRKMLLEVGDTKYEQETVKPVVGDRTKQFPYSSVDAVRTTWGEWRKLHPESELYAGGQLRSPTTQK